MAVVEEIIFSVIEKLRKLQKESKGTRLCPQVQESVNKLQNVQKELEDQENNGLSLELVRAVYRAEDSIDTYFKEIRKEFYQQNVLVKVFSPAIQLRTVYIQARFNNKIEKFVGHVEDMRGKMLKDAGLGGSAAKNDDSDKKIGVMGLKDEAKKLAELIISGYSSVFSIWVVDVAFSARTTELWKMYECEDVKMHFQCRAWVQIPQELEKRKLVIDILKQVAGPEVDQEKLSSEPQKEFCDFLIQRRYLIVLIDVWTPDIWEILRFLFPNSSNGSRVILSFQEADAARCRNIRFYGRELSLNPKNTRVASGTSKDDVGNDVNYLPSQVSDAQILEETDIVGMKDEILKLARLTLHGGNKYFLISVVGVAGSGKTTLVKTVYNSSHIRINFECRAWVNVYVSHDFDMRNVVINLLEQVTRAKVDEELQLKELESKLAGILEQKKYLIVLDDVSLPGAWYELEWIFSRKSSNGSRVILITREAHVARSFSQSIFLLQLRLLNKDESNELFLKKVGRDQDSREELLEKIWELCGALPLAICVLGGLLSNFPDSDWLAETEKIMLGRKKKGLDQQEVSSNENQSIFLDQLASRDTSSIWRLGYKFLSPHLKASLNYLYLFPKSYEIPVRRLLQLWLAEQLVTPIEGIAPEDQAKKDFKQLEIRNMIEVVKRRSDGRPKTCRVPSTLYDTFFTNAENMGIFHCKRRSDSTSNSAELCVRRLAEHLDTRNNHLEDKYIGYLHSYVSFDNRKGDKPAEEVGNFLNKTITKRRFRLLRVLDLEGVYKPVLPETIGKLRLLRYVGLRWTFLDSIPASVGNLPCLETLDVKHTNISTLPASIWKAKTLRHLYMNEIYLQISIQKPFVRFSLTKLQTLWGLLIGNKSPPVNFLKSLSGLRKLGLTCHTASLAHITEWIEGLTNLESLRLRSINDFGEPSDLNFLSLRKHEKLTELYLLGNLKGAIDESKLPKKLRIFTLSLSHLSEDPMQVLGQLKELNTLRIFAHSYLGEKMTCHKGGFPELLVLKLWMLKELKDWTVEEGSMPKLKELEIRNCQKLRKPVGLEKVTTLKELTLTNMKEDFEAEVRGSMAKTVNLSINPPRDKSMAEGKESELMHNTA